jgi:hypothetical protein
MPERTPDGQLTSTDGPQAEQPDAGQPASQPEDAEATEQPDEEDEPQAGSPS